MTAPELNQQLETDMTQQQSQEQAKTDRRAIDDMLNDKGFTEFLGEYERAGKRIDLSDKNVEQIQERHQRYQQVGSTIKEVQGILAKELSNETGVNISSSEIDGARDYLEKMAVNNEGEFERTLETIKDYHKISEQTDQLIEEVSQKFEALDKKQGTLDEVKQISGFKRWVRLGLDEKQSQAITNAKALKLDVHHPENSELALEKEGGSATKQVEGMLTQQLKKFDVVRMELMTSLGENTGALKIAQDKLTQKFKESVGTSLGDVDKAASMYSEYSASEEDDELTFKYLEGVDGFTREEYEKQLNDESESRVTEEIKKAIDQSPLTQGRQFGQLESTLDKYTKRETLGTKNQEETGEFVLGVVHEMYSRYATNPMRFQNKDIMSKSFLLQRILIKNDVNPKEDYAKVQIDAEATAQAEKDDLASLDATGGKRSYEESKKILEENKQLAETNKEGATIANSPDITDDAPPINDPDQFVPNTPDLNSTPEQLETPPETPAVTQQGEERAVPGF